MDNIEAMTNPVYNPLIACNLNHLNQNLHLIYKQPILLDPGATTKVGSKTFLE